MIKSSLSLVVIFTAMALSGCSSDIDENMKSSELTKWIGKNVRIQFRRDALGAVALFVGTIGALVYKELRINNQTRNLIINATVLAAIVILFMVFIVAMFTPLIVIITNLKN
jgi:hypothetical protein